MDLTHFFIYEDTLLESLASFSEAMVSPLLGRGFRGGMRNLSPTFTVKLEPL